MVVLWPLPRQRSLPSAMSYKGRIEPFDLWPVWSKEGGGANLDVRMATNLQQNN